MTLLVTWLACYDSVQAWASRGGVPIDPPRPFFVPTCGYFLSLPFKFLVPGTGPHSGALRATDPQGTGGRAPTLK